MAPGSRARITGSILGGGEFFLLPFSSLFLISLAYYRLWGVGGQYGGDGGQRGGKAWGRAGSWRGRRGLRGCAASVAPAPPVFSQGWTLSSALSPGITCPRID